MNVEAGYEELVTILCNGISHRSLYFNNHPKVRTCAEEFARKLQPLLEADGKEAFFLGVVQGRLVHEGRYMIGPSLLGRRLIDLAVRMKSGGFLFRGAVRSHELCELFALSAEIKDPTSGLEESRGMLKARGVESIEVSPDYDDPGWFGQFLYDGEESWGGHVVDAEGMERAIPIYQSLFETVEIAHSRASSDSELDIDGARGVSEALVKATEGQFSDILQLVRYPDYDSYTVGHSVRVALLSVLVGHYLRMPPEFLLEVGTAGLLHDVGKAKIPHEILYKPARLDDEERRIMSRHPSHGAQILLENRDASQLAIGAAWGHHLRYDGTGYPAATPWAVTSKVTKLLQVCDVFEALTAVRPYKPAFPPRKAYEIMLKDDGAFDPMAFRALVRAMGLYPPGSRVLLTSGERGLVLEAGPRPDLPVVQITHDETGGAVATPDAPVRKLAATGGSVEALLQDGESPRPRAAEPDGADSTVDLPELDFGCGSVRA